MTEELRNKTTEEVINAISKVANIEKVMPDYVIGDMNLDSLDYANIIMMLEEQFHITIEDEELDDSDITTVQDLINLVIKHVENESSEVK